MKIVEALFDNSSFAVVGEGDGELGDRKLMVWNSSDDREECRIEVSAPITFVKSVLG